MIRGINKRVIVIHNPPGDTFDEAYFILKSNRSIFKPSGDDLVLQANNLLASYNAEAQIAGGVSGNAGGSGGLDFKLSYADPSQAATRSKVAATAVRRDKKQLKGVRFAMAVSFVCGALAYGIAQGLIRMLG